MRKVSETERNLSGHDIDIQRIHYKNFFIQRFKEYTVKLHIARPPD
jgi:hypothetical protein